MSDLMSLYRKMLNRHYTMAADEYKENVSYWMLSKHDEEFREAEGEFLTALSNLQESIRKEKP